jgi:hypothetical protein
MLNTTAQKRRSFIKMAMSTPMLPMGSIGLATAFNSPALLATEVSSGFKSAEFIAMEAPTLANPEAMATT